MKEAKKRIRENLAPEHAKMRERLLAKSTMPKMPSQWPKIQRFDPAFERKLLYGKRQGCLFGVCKNTARTNQVYAGVSSDEEIEEEGILFTDTDESVSLSQDEGIFSDPEAARADLTRIERAERRKEFDKEKYPIMLKHWRVKVGEEARRAVVVDNFDDLTFGEYKQVRTKMAERLRSEGRRFEAKQEMKSFYSMGKLRFPCCRSRHRIKDAAKRVKHSEAEARAQERQKELKKFLEDEERERAEMMKTQLETEAKFERYRMQMGFLYRLGGKDVVRLRAILLEHGKVLFQ